MYNVYETGKMHKFSNSTVEVSERNTWEKGKICRKEKMTH